MRLNGSVVFPRVLVSRRVFVNVQDVAVKVVFGGRNAVLLDDVTDKNSLGSPRIKANRRTLFEKNTQINWVE